jgi:hypothetical protein
MSECTDCAVYLEQIQVLSSEIEQQRAHYGKELERLDGRVDELVQAIHALISDRKKENL